MTTLEPDAYFDQRDRRYLNNHDHIPQTGVTGDMASAIAPTQDIPCIEFSRLGLQINHTDDNDPAGTISIRGCESGLTADMKAVPITDGMITSKSASITLVAGTLLVTGSVGPGHAHLIIKDPHNHMDVIYTPSGGGAGALLKVIAGGH